MESLITEWICDAPPGQVSDVYNDVKELFGLTSKHEGTVRNAFARHNSEQLVEVKTTQCRFHLCNQGACVLMQVLFS